MTFKARWFYFVNEYVGQNRLSDIQNNFRKKLSNGVQINRYTLTAPLKHYIITNKFAFFNQLPASTKIISNVGWFPETSLAYIQSQAAELREMTSSLGYHRVWWNLMFEYDQYGGPWAEGRRIDKSSRQKAYGSWKNYYLTKVPPLEEYLQQNRSKRGVSIAAVSDFCFTVHYSFELGADMCLLERNNDELGDIQTGISFIRGAARQYDRPWGINISNWRSSTDSPTIFNDQMQLIGGWSPSYMRRHFYISYMSGAHVILNEALVYYDRKGIRPNPIAKVVEEVANFSLVRHPNIPSPAVSAALMLDFHHGFEPKYGKHMQVNYVWYARIPYDDGDFMTHNFFEMLFPEYWRTGTLPKSAPQTPTALRHALENGADPRPWEPMGQSRWGDQFDVILSNASPEALRNYKTIFLIGNVRLSPELKTKLQTWVSEGGTLLANVSQVTEADEDFLGVRLTGSVRSAARSYWFADSTTYSEPSYRYEIVRPLAAKSIARNEGGDPLITRRQMGSGEVLLATPRYLLDAKKKCILTIGQKLVDALVGRHAEATVSGPFMVEYLVNKDSSKTVVTVVNNSGSNWYGSVIINRDEPGFTTKEWLSDSTVNHTHVSGKTMIPSFVPAYDLRMYALEITSRPTVRKRNLR